MKAEKNVTTHELVEHYVGMAHEMRANEIRKSFKAFVGAIVAVFAKARGIFSIPRTEQL